MQKTNLAIIIPVITLVVGAVLGVWVTSTAMQANKGGNLASNTVGIMGAVPSDALLAQISQYSEEPPAVVAFTARQFTSAFFYSPFAVTGPVPVADVKLYVNGNAVSGLTLQMQTYSYSATGYPVVSAGYLQGKSVVVKVGDRIKIVVVDAEGKEASKEVVCKNFFGRGAYCY